MVKTYQKYFFIVTLVFLNLLIWGIYFSHKRGDLMKVSFLNVGQGDAIFIEAPNGRQLLIDGGKDTSVINELGRSMGFFDRSIDIVLATHPDLDHIGGLPLVFDKYVVDHFIDSVADGQSNAYDALLQKARTEDSEYYLGLRGMKITLDEKNGVYLHVLYPGPDDFTIDETNDLSIITKLVYGDTSFMLTADAGKMPETQLYATDKNYLKSSVLKAGHHGSRTSSSGSFVRMVDPAYAVISAGKDNSYGHPHKEVIDTLEKENIEILNTSEEGTIKFFSNGVDVWQK